MKTKLLALFLLAGASVFAHPRVFLSFGFGGYAPGYYGSGYYVATAPPPVVAYAPPPCPGPGYSWVGGYWYPVGPRYYYHRGYWARPPYRGAYWVSPRYYGHRYYHGYWRR